MDSLFPRDDGFYFLALHPSGFEKIFKNEINSRCSEVKFHWEGNGATFFESSCNPWSLIGKDCLRSVDRIMAYVYHGELSTGEDALQQLRELPKNIDWTQPLQVWKHMFPEKPDPFTEKEKITFRATAERYGLDDKRQKYTSHDAAIQFGSGVNDLMGWKAKMKGYELELFIDIKNDQVCIGISICDYRPNIQHKDCVLSKLRNRTEVGRTTLSSAVSYSMCQLADIKPGQVILDPMAGVGSIPTEGGQVFEQSLFLLGDLNMKEVEKAFINVKAHVPKSNTMTPIGWDVKSLPLKDNCVDAIITDLPFGHRHGSHAQNANLYPLMLKEFNRILKIGGKAVLLTLARGLMRRVLENNEEWNLEESFCVDISGFQAELYILKKIQV